MSQQQKDLSNYKTLLIKKRPNEHLLQNRTSN